LTLSSFFDLNSSKTGLMLANCCFSVPFPFQMPNWVSWVFNYQILIVQRSKHEDLGMIKQGLQLLTHKNRRK
jgi:hypothetical protein